MPTAGNDRPARGLQAGQLLFDLSVNRNDANVTTITAPAIHSSLSRTAARRIQEDAGRLEGLVLQALRDAGRRGLTDVRLFNAGVVVDSGRLATVWLHDNFQ